MDEVVKAVVAMLKSLSDEDIHDYSMEVNYDKQQVEVTLKTKGQELPKKVFPVSRRPSCIDRFLVQGSLTLSIETNPQGQYWLALTDEDDLLLSSDCDSLEEAKGILDELDNEITIDWIRSYGFEF